MNNFNGIPFHFNKNRGQNIAYPSQCVQGRHKKNIFLPDHNMVLRILWPQNQSKLPYAAQPGSSEQILEGMGCRCGLRSAFYTGRLMEMEMLFWSSGAWIRSDFLKCSAKQLPLFRLELHLSTFLPQFYIWFIMLVSS